MTNFINSITNLKNSERNNKRYFFGTQTPKDF